MANLEERINSVIDEEIESIINAAETKAVMRGYYTAWAGIATKLVDADLCGYEASHIIDTITNSYGPNWFAGCGADELKDELQFFPVVLLRDYLENYALEKLLPPIRYEGMDKTPWYKFLEESISDCDWCGIASDLAEEFDKE